MLRDYQRNALAQVRAAGGEIVGLTSMAQADADRAAESWGIGFPLLADPSCTLVDLLNERGWIASVVERGADFTASDGLFSTAILGSGQYAVGMLQPGVVALRGEVAVVTAEPSGPPPQVLLTWGSVPGPKNINGAAGRLPARAAWRAVELSLSGDFSLARPAVDRDGPSVPWQLFWLLLMARGNFVQPQFFTMDVETAGDVSKGGRSLKGMMQGAMAKAAVALSLTAAGLWRAPKPTAGALAAYTAYFFSPGGPYATLRKTFERPDSSPPASRL